MRLARILVLAAAAVGSSAFQRARVGGKAIHSWESPTNINTIAMPLFGRSILNALGLGRFVETEIPRAGEQSASEADSRGPEALKKCVQALRAGGGTPTEKYGGAGLAVLEGAPKLPLTFKELDALILCASATLVCNGRVTVGSRMDYANHKSMRTFFPISLGGSQTGIAAELWQAIVDMADGGDNHAKVFVEWKGAMEPVVSRAYGKPMMVKSGSAVRVEHEGYSRAHGDGAHFEARTVSVVMDEPSATKRVSIGLARDDRPRGTRRLLHSPWWIYLGDLVLRNKDTYIGDVVAMGGKRVGGGGLFSWYKSSALIHRVNPVQGAEWVLIMDWIPVA